MAPTVPSFPFQYVVGDYFSLAGVNYLMLGDWFSGWLSIYSAGQGEFEAKSLVQRTRQYFLENKPHSKVVSRDDGSSRITTRN